MSIEFPVYVMTPSAGTITTTEAVSAGSWKEVMPETSFAKKLSPTVL